MKLSIYLKSKAEKASIFSAVLNHLYKTCILWIKKHFFIAFLSESDDNNIYIIKADNFDPMGKIGCAVLRLIRFKD